MLDILETPIRDAISFGGSSDESLYEIIGDKQFNYILKKLNKITDASGNLSCGTLIPGTVPSGSILFKLIVKASKIGVLFWDSTVLTKFGKEFNLSISFKIGFKSVLDESFKRANSKCSVPT